MNLDDVVRAVPGVQALYSAAPALVASARQIAAGGADVALVAVKETAEGLDIIANIAVASSAQAPQTAAAVSAALLAALPAGTPASVHVRISRVLG